MSNTVRNKELDALLEEARGIIETAQLEGRARTPEEEHRVVDIHARLKSLRDYNGEMDGFLYGHGEIEEITQTSISGDGHLGDFVFSEGYKKIKSSSGRGQSWSSGAVPISMKGTLLKGTTAGTLVPAQYQPGIVSKLAQPVGLADYFGQAQTTASHWR
jgi:hypothetical protein